MESFKKALREDFEKVLDANRRKPDTLITILYILVLNSSKLKLPVDLLEPLMDVIIEDEVLANAFWIILIITIPGTIKII